MFGGLPTPTETESPDGVLTVSAAIPPPLLVVHEEYQQNADDSNTGHQDDSNIGGHLTTSQSAHITLRFLIALFALFIVNSSHLIRLVSLFIVF